MPYAFLSCCINIKGDNFEIAIYKFIIFGSNRKSVG